MPTYYSDATEASDICGKVSADVKAYMQRGVDRMIERYSHQGYKGATKVLTWAGDGNALIVLPSRGASVTSIYENGVLLDSSNYSFHGSGTAPSRIVKRTNTTNIWSSYMPLMSSGAWFKDCEYVVTYVEPTVIPDDWKDTANQCVAIYLMFKDKFTDSGIALTESSTGQAGGRGGNVSSGGATSWPAALMEELNRTIRLGIPRVGV